MLARAEKQELGGVQAIYRRRRTETQFSDGKCWLRRFRRLLRSRFRRTDWAEIGLFADESPTQSKESLFLNTCTSTKYLLNSAWIGLVQPQLPLIEITNFKR